MTARPVPWEAGKVFVIAEAGVNHNGEIDLAKRLIDVAAESGADAVKFQTWKPGELTGKFAVKVAYLEQTTPADESRVELSRRLALPFEAFRDLQAYAEERGILFLSTPDGFQSLDFLADELDLPVIKVGSTEVTHPQFLRAVGRKDRPVVLSTGMSTLAEVEAALGALTAEAAPPIAVLQCTSEYPAPYDQVNLRAMVTMKEAFGLPVGFSDHSLGLEASIAAVALGAVVIEKHFTLDKDMPGPDHRASLEPEELARLVGAIRNTEALLGTGRKQPTAAERANMTGIRRSVVAARAIPAGTVLQADMLTCKRPGDGIAPALLDSLVGLKVNRALQEDEPVQWDCLK